MALIGKFVGVAAQLAAKRGDGVFRCGDKRLVDVGTIRRMGPGLWISHPGTHPTATRAVTLW